MNNGDFSRYSRQIFIEKIGIAGQRKICKANILVVGAGGLGSAVIQYLAAAGVGTLTVADFDKVEIHNLNRQIIHNENTVGKSKVESAEKFVQNLNSQVKFLSLKKKITSENSLEILSDFDVVIDCSDNFTTRYLVNDTCNSLGKPLVYGSILGFEGQVAVFNFNNGKNLRDIFPEPPDGILPDCDSLGVLGPLPGIIGSMMADLALKIILDFPVPVNKLTVFNSWSWEFQILDF